MEQVISNMTARRDCFKCLQARLDEGGPGSLTNPTSPLTTLSLSQAGKHNAYECAACGRVVEPADRKVCFDCMDAPGDTYGKGRACAAKFGIKEWSKATDGGPAVTSNE